MSVKLKQFSYPSIQTCVLGAQKNRLIETVLLSTHNLCFGWEIMKIYFQYELLSGGLSLFSDKFYFFQPLYESQNLKSHNRFSSSSGTSQGSGDPIFYNKAPPGGQQPGMSSISNNLTELDQLLSDLNSAQFLAEVDKKHPSGSIIVVKGLSVYPCSIIFLLIIHSKP